MWYLLRKEVNFFFSSLTGYLVVLVFLAVTGTCLWVLPGVLNIPDSGYASLDSLFYIAPWVFLFLIPAITMRSFSEEIKSGTIELLLTKPIGEMQLVSAKFLAAVLLIFISLLPCAVYFASVWFLGNPPGNLDTGAACGAMIGLFFLASVYASSGVFISSLTDNQVVAFISTAVLCFVFYEGFDALAQPISSPVLKDFVSTFGIKGHYTSISRGVIDSRDLIYFLVIILLFLFLTRLKLQSRKWK